MVRMLEEQDLVPDGTAWLATSEARVLEVLGELGAATAKQIKERVPDLDLQFTFGEGTKWAGTVGATTRLMFLMATQADIIRARPLGSWISGQYRWTRVEDWVRSPLRDVDEQEARDELVTRWLRTYGPGTETDIKWWTGWGVRQTRQSLDRIGAVAVEVESGNAFVLPDDVDPEPDQTPTIALLPSLDPAVMGWKERHWFVGPHQERVFDRNGNVGPTVWSDGRIVGAWAQRRDGEIAVGYLEDPGRDAREAIDQRAEELRQWFGEVRTTPRFPAPLDKELRS